MRQAAALVLLLTVWLSDGKSAFAEDPAGLLARVTVGGASLECRDFRGALVRSIRMDDLGDVAHARIINRMPIITLNQARLDTLPSKLQIFFFNHECGHHVMGHVFNPSPTSENEADCWSIKHGRSAGLFTRADVVAFGPHLAQSRGSPFGHLPGPQRAARLIACFDDPSTDNLVDPSGFEPSSTPQVAETAR